MKNKVEKTQEEITNEKLRRSINNRFFKVKIPLYIQFRKYCVTRSLSYDKGIREAIIKLMEKDEYRYNPKYVYLYFKHYLIDKGVFSVTQGTKEAVKLILEIKD